MKEKIIIQLLGGEIVFRRSDLNDEQFERVAGYTEKFIKDMVEKEFTPPTKEQIRQDLLT